MATQQWKTDPVHSEVQFKVKHLMITTVTGHFKKFEVIVELKMMILLKHLKLNLLQK